MTENKAIQSPINPQQKRNAFTALMSQKLPAEVKKIRTAFSPLDDLLAYIKHPETFPSSSVISYTLDYVCIRDIYPKAVVHALLLPRNESKMLVHPIIAFDDEEFLTSTREAAKGLKSLVAAELRRKFGDQDGRDWEAEVRVGIHMRPSMNHLHVHVISRDNYSERLKNAKHYTTFNTPFFINLDEFPLSKDDERRDHGIHYTKGDLVCWRCRKNFGRSFKALKDHLAIEFTTWKGEKNASPFSSKGPSGSGKDPGAKQDMGSDTE